jgi:hypothetical protein
MRYLCIQTRITEEKVTMEGMNDTIDFWDPLERVAITKGILIRKKYKFSLQIITVFSNGLPNY